MYTRMLIPLDGSKIAENVLPYARFVAGQLKIPVELLAAIDIPEMVAHMAGENARYLDTLIEDGVRSSKAYLKRVATTFDPANVKCTVEKGSPEEVIIDKAAGDKNTLIAMATHGRSGINRWLLGSVTEKVLRGASNPLLLIRAPEEAKSEGQVSLNSVIVPLDGSELAETVLPAVSVLAKSMNLEVVLASAYSLPVSCYYRAEDYQGSAAYLPSYEELTAEMSKEARGYLDAKVEAIRRQGIVKVRSVVMEGAAADEIIRLGQRTADNLIVMCTHGRSGVKRWVLGSVTEKVVRHSRNPVLVIPARENSARQGRVKASEPIEEMRDFMKYSLD